MKKNVITLLALGFVILVPATNFSETQNLVFVEGGSFIMGDESGGINIDDKPLHKITLNSFYISKFEVTVQEFKDFVKVSGYLTSTEITGEGCYIWMDNYWKHDEKTNYNNPGFLIENNHPVTCLNWWDAIKYCNWKSKKEGFPVSYNESTGDLLDNKGNITTNVTKVKGYRLPTEAEWEFSARGGKMSKNYSFSGGNSPELVGWISKNSGKRLHPVGTRIANELGIYDMTGNVWEWCTDWFGFDYYANSPEKNPYNVVRNYRQVIRGGGWGGYIPFARVSFRFAESPFERSNNIGFRVCRSL